MLLFMKCDFQKDLVHDLFSYWCPKSAIIRWYILCWQCLFLGLQNTNSWSFYYQIGRQKKNWPANLICDVLSFGGKQSLVCCILATNPPHCFAHRREPPWQGHWSRFGTKQLELTTDAMGHHVAELRQWRRGRFTDSMGMGLCYKDRRIVWPKCNKVV